MRFLRLAATSLLALLVASGATAATRTQTGSTALAAPQDLHGFMLRADEPSADTFSRTPSFAWKPVRGAQRYQFQLATARTFASGAVLWSSKTLTAPAASLPIALPWITGTPYSIYAHVRGVAPDGSTGPWSSPFGFNMRWSNLPTPLSSPSGMIRWTTVDGASAYQVWYLEPNKIFETRSDVADEREYYTFHNDSSVVHWRIRAVRDLYGIDESGHEQNGLPTVSYGPWSPIYTSTNTGPSSGAVQTVETISDTISSPAMPAAHHLMPAFVYSGNTSLNGSTDWLYRVYVATDRDCVNVVFRGSVVGGPAYAPRMTGPLALPDNAAAAVSSNKFLPDGSQGTTFTADHYAYQSNEALPGDQTPISSGEDDSPSTDTGAPAGGSTTTTTSTGSTGTSTGAPGVATLSTSGVLVGPPVDLWDTDWPTGRYYWTVVPVGMYVEAALSTVLTNSPAAGATTINVAAASQLGVSDMLSIGAGPSLESVSVIGVAGSTVTVSPALHNAHGAGETVTRVGGSIEYRDEELPQDACAAGRVATFGKTSEPALTASSNLAPFASGLTPAGTLASARGPKPWFYGAPLVSWQPALGASAYEVQWSTSKYPFKMAATPILTYGTSTVLSLSPGTWWYRVRGIDLSLPAGARAMAWSPPVALVVAKPKFTVVGGQSGSSSSSSSSSRKSKSSTMRAYHKGAFTMSLPKTWRELSTKDTIYLFVASDSTVHSGIHGVVDVVGTSGRSGRTMSQWTQDLAAQAKALASGPVSSRVVTERAGQAVLLTYDSTKIAQGHTVRAWQYAFDAGAQGYLVTFLATPSTQKVYAKVFAAAASSFSIN